ncbi:MAG: hypothetical protein RJA81_967, partial [Planctomycetota bacterium]
RLLPVPDGFVLMAPNRVWPVLRTPILSLKAKLRLMLEPFIPKASADSDESLASFVRRRLGNEVLQRLVQPLVGGIYTADPESLSLRSTMPQFIEMEQKHGSLLRASLFGKSRGSSQVDKQSSGARYGLFATLRTGMGRLTQSLRDHLPKDAIHLETAVREIVPAVNQSGWQVHLSNGSQIRADGVVIATETHHAAEMVRHFDGKLASELLTIPYASSAIALVGFDRSQIRHPLNGFGLVVPACENRKILAISFTSVKLPDRAPKGKVLLRVFVGGAMQPELYSLSDEEIKKIVIEETSELLGITGGPCLYQLARHHRSMPQYTLGHQQRVERIREGFKTHQGLVFASNALAGVGVPDCVRTAQLAAKELFGQLF